jgi:hypothetical protein
MSRFTIFSPEAAQHKCTYVRETPYINTYDACRRMAQWSCARGHRHELQVTGRSCGTILVGVPHYDGAVGVEIGIGEATFDQLRLGDWRTPICLTHDAVKMLGEVEVREKPLGR